MSRRFDPSSELRVSHAWLHACPAAFLRESRTTSNHFLLRVGPRRRQHESVRSTSKCRKISVLLSDVCNRACNPLLRHSTELEWRTTRGRMRTLEGIYSHLLSSRTDREQCQRAMRGANLILTSLLTVPCLELRSVAFRVDNGDVPT